MPNYTIYISAAVDGPFGEEPNKSGLVNDLLLMHYGRAPSSPSARHYPKRTDTAPEKKSPPTAKPSVIEEKREALRPAAEEAFKIVEPILKAQNIPTCKHGAAIGLCKFGCKK